MPTEPEPLTLAQIVHRAVTVIDPDGVDEDLADLLVRFEDADEPVTAVGDIEQRMAEATGALDPEAEVPAVQVAGAVATYLAFRRDETGDDPDSIIRLAVRAEYDGKPPAHVANWLEAQGVEY
jgi:hypothetical protein